MRISVQRISVQWVASWVLVLALGQVARADLPPWPPQPQPSEAQKPEPKPQQGHTPMAGEPSRRPASCQPAQRQTGLGLGPAWLLLIVGAGLFASRRRWA